jgi:hypothetical protein
VKRAARQQTRRGGARNTGRRMPSNTSGLAAIGFKVDGAVVHATTCMGEARRERSISGHGARKALRQVIELRARAGYPVPHINTAMRAYRAWAEHHQVL